MEWYEIVSEILALVTSLCGLIGTALGAYFAVKTFIEKTKVKEKNEIWAMIMDAADAAMKQAEESGKSGEDKKAMVIAIVGAGLKGAGLDITDFLDELNAYIDQTIQFVNDMTKKETK